MTKWTDAKLKKEAIRDYKECYECGHYPDWTNDCEYYTYNDWKKMAKEYDMTVPEFKKYVNYFFEYDATRT